MTDFVETILMEDNENSIDPERLQINKTPGIIILTLFLLKLLPLQYFAREIIYGKIPITPNK
jgi:hypothetical protein